MIFWILGLLAVHFAVLWWLNQGVQNIVNFTQKTGSEPEAEFTIVIPFRNEEENIPKLFESLRNQNHEKNSVHIIFINDDSTDRSVSQLKELIKGDFPFRTKLLNLENTEGQGKKKALFKAIQSATTQFIIQIDCDIVIKQQWLESVIQNVNKETDLLVLPVNINGRKQWFQEFEFSALQFVTFGMAGNKTPILCNGANLVYRKSAWLNAFGAIKKGDSGDDIFLLQEFLKKKLTIKYALSKNLVARTPSVKSLNKYFDQRLRWARKNKNVSIPKYGAVTFYLGIMQLIPFFVCGINWKIGAPILLFKILTDYYFVRKYRKLNKEETSIVLFLVSGLIMPFYLIALLILPLFTAPTWKGRKVNV
ncbi:MAG: cellulose synthase/poly-beta-1,6-N-acetylglucosamine synthase-like glycosyltransferase [Salibacteraceae bacterium]|jgi:cellulose synthase/poly-beta-1,6-N-acetylglucosamine synthase-like glycosyltransferase